MRNGKKSREKPAEEHSDGKPHEMPSTLNLPARSALRLSMNPRKREKLGGAQEIVNRDQMEGYHRSSADDRDVLGTRQSAASNHDITG
jgi:hypothetical protein